MQALQELLPGILQGPGYPAWMCILCPRLQLSQRFSHEVKPLPLSSSSAEYPSASSIFTLAVFKTSCQAALSVFHCVTLSLDFSMY